MFKTTHQSTTRHGSPGDRRAVTGKLAQMTAELAVHMHRQLGPQLPNGLYRMMLYRQLASMGIDLQFAVQPVTNADSSNNLEPVLLDRRLWLCCLDNRNAAAAVSQQLWLQHEDMLPCLMIHFADPVAVQFVQPVPGSQSCH